MEKTGLRIVGVILAGLVFLGLLYLAGMFTMWMLLKGMILAGVPIEYRPLADIAFYLAWPWLALVMVLGIGAGGSK